METAETTAAEQESAELEPAETEPADLAQESDETMLAYSEENTVAENRESNTLHLIELALVIVIAWLLVAMIALPRLRRPEA
jgi:hypothetical protein